jgi:hypothetical protein
MSDDRARDLVNQGPFPLSITARLAERTLAERTRRAAHPGEGDPTLGIGAERAVPAPESAPAHIGPRIRVDSLELPMLERDALGQDLNPPNLVVVGGSARMAREIAGRIQETREGGIREIDWSVTPGDLAAIASSLNRQDVLLVTSLDRLPEGTIDVLADLLTVHDVTSVVDRTFTEPTGRLLGVTIGTGDAARYLALTFPAFWIVARTWTGKVPEPLRDWGAQLVISQETTVCPRCAEEVKAAAHLCRFCGFEFGPVTPP